MPAGFIAKRDRRLTGGTPPRQVVDGRCPRCNTELLSSYKGRERTCHICGFADYEGLPMSRRQQQEV